MELARTGAISLKQFYLRRTLRIFPPMYIVLAVACALPLLGVYRGSVHASTVLLQAAHLTNYYIIAHGWWDGIAPGTWVYWSLAVEEHFYLAFPLFYIGLTRYVASRDRQALVFASLCCVVLAWRMVQIFVFHAWKIGSIWRPIPASTPILMGCILAVWKNPVLDREAFNEKRLAWLWVPLGALSIVLSIVIRVPWFEQTLRYSMQSVGLIPLFIASIRFHDRGLYRVLNWAPVRYVGVLSYSLYLMHTAALWAFEERTTLSPLLRGLLVFTLLMVLAALMHRYVDKPSVRLRRDISRWMSRDTDRAGRRPKPMAA